MSCERLFGPLYKVEEPMEIKKVLVVDLGASWQSHAGEALTGKNKRGGATASQRPRHSGKTMY